MSGTVWSFDSAWGGQSMAHQDISPPVKVGSGVGIPSPPAVAIAENQRGELLETSYSHQLTAKGGKPGQGYPAARVGSRVRRLTPLECERLMGWPDDHTRYGITVDGVEVELPDSVRYRQCGNGVVANVAWWIAMQLNAAVEAE